MLVISVRWQSRSKLTTLEWELRLVAVRKQWCVRFQHHGQHVTEHEYSLDLWAPTRVDISPLKLAFLDKLYVQLCVFYRPAYVDLSDLVWMCSHAWIHSAVARLICNFSLINLKHILQCTESAGCYIINFHNAEEHSDEFS